MEFIAEIFAGKDDGFLIDVGAHDGVEKGSMSRGLIKRGWSGLLIEPLKEAFLKLQQAYADRTDVICLNVACSDAAGQAKLYPNKGVSTLDPAWAKACEDYWEHVNYGEPYMVKLRKLSGVLSGLRELGKCPPSIDYLQIDTEGHDLQVLKGMDWTYNPRVICVETLDMTRLDRRDGRKWKPAPELTECLGQHGYELRMLTNGGNGIYMRTEC